MPNRTEIDYPTVQNMIESARREAAGNVPSAASIGGFADLTPIGPWPVSIRQFKGKAFVTLKVAVPAGTVRLKTVLEQYTGAGPTVTVVRRINDVDQELPASIGTTGGVFTFEFGIGLSFNANYGCPKLVAIMSDGTRVVNPIPDVPDSPRLLTDYLPSSTFTLGDAFGSISAPALNLIIYNSLDPITPDIYDAHAGLRVYAPTTDAGAAQTWGAFLGANQTATVQSIINRDYGPDGIIDTPYPHVLKDLELTQVDPTSTPANRGYVDIEANALIPGGQYFWIENKVSVNGEKKTATGNVAFTAANFSTDITQLTNLALSVVSTDPFDGKHVQPFLEFTQPPTPVALKNYTVLLKKSAATDWSQIVHRGLRIQTEALHIQLNAGTISITSGTKNMTGIGTQFTRLQEGWKIKQGVQTFVIGTITDDTHLTVTVNAASIITTQTYVVVCVISLVPSMKVKPSSTYNLRVVLRARGITVTTLNLTFSTDADGNVIVDADVPTLSSPSTPTIEDLDGHIMGNAPTPIANIHTLKTFYFVMSTSNVHPTDNVIPVVGVDGIVQVRYGQAVRFKPKRPQGVNLYFYYIVDNDVGLSAWSTGVLLTPAGITRPILDNVALAVPLLSERMERTGFSSGVGHDANHFVLDSGASAIDDFYKDRFLHIPSFDGGSASQKSSTIRKITAYVGSTRTCTIGIAFDSVPVGSIAYDIWRADIKTQGNYGDHGSKSRTVHSLTTFQLAVSDAAGTANFFLGYTLYIPSFAVGDQIRKISGYNEFTGTVTVDIAFGSNHNGESHGYLLINGSIGYSSPANAGSQTGSPAPVPFRWYLDSNKNYRFETLPSTGADANALTHLRIQLRRESNGVVRGDTGAVPIGSSSPPTLPSIASNSAATILMRNNYRGPNQDGTSDGWSDESTHVHVGSSGDNSNYDPSLYGSQPILDYQGSNSYPIRISSY